MKRIIPAIVVLFAITSTSCVAVKEYDKVFLNDEEMILAAKRIEIFETNFHLYREAAAGANGGKTGGGCGCN